MCHFLFDKFVVQFLLCFGGFPFGGAWVKNVCECFVCVVFHDIVDVVMVVPLFFSISDLGEDCVGGSVWIF